MTDYAENHRPRCSIGMPVFNAEAYLAEVLDSLLGQYYRDFELIICDNASTDQTWAICEDYAGRDRRIRLLRNARNIGAAANYNRVVHEARGSLFKWAAADDLVAPDFMARCVAALDADPGAVLSFTQTTIIGAHGETLSEYVDNLDVTATDPVQRFCSFVSLVQECNAVFGLIRMDALRQTPLIGTFVGSDIHLLAELSLHGRFVEIPERLFYRREHEACSSADKSLRAQMEFFDPSLVDRIVFPAWSAQAANFGALFRAQLTPGQRWRLFSLLARRMVWNRGHLARDLGDAFSVARHRLGGRSRAAN